MSGYTGRARGVSKVAMTYLCDFEIVEPLEPDVHQ